MCSDQVLSNEGYPMEYHWSSLEQENAKAEIFLHVTWSRVGERPRLAQVVPSSAHSCASPCLLSIFPSLGMCVFVLDLCRLFPGDSRQNEPRTTLPTKNTPLSVHRPLSHLLSEPTLLTCAHEIPSEFHLGNGTSISSCYLSLHRAPHLDGRFHDARELVFATGVNTRAESE
jgi:hypothetical protein